MVAWCRLVIMKPERREEVRLYVLARVLGRKRT
jgi:hypothetical protein